jgi:hypothetical protein
MPNQIYVKTNICKKTKICEAMNMKNTITENPITGKSASGNLFIINPITKKAASALIAGLMTFLLLSGVSFAADTGKTANATKTADAGKTVAVAKTTDAGNTAAVAETANAAKTADTAKITEVPDRKIILEGVPASYKNVPIAIGGNTMLPLRELFVSLGVPNDDEHIMYKRVSTDERYVTVLYGETRVELTIGKPEAIVNGEKFVLNTAPVIYKNNTYIPVRFIAEALGKKVVWVKESNAVLIIDQKNYENIRQIMNISAEAMANAVKYRMEMDVAAAVRSDGVKTDIGIKTDARVDKGSMSMYMESVIGMFGIEMKSGTYYQGNMAYAFDPLTEQWLKTTYAPEEYDRLFEAHSGMIRMEAEEKLYAGLKMEENEKENELVLSGSTWLTSQFAEAYRQQSGSLVMDGSEMPEFGVCSLRFVFDKDTYMLKSYTMETSAVSHDEDVTTIIDISSTIRYSEINGEFEIVVPEDVKENAVEAVPITSGDTVSF